MTMSMDMSVHRRVASGTLSAEEGAQQLMEAQRKARMLKQPKWMPKPLYVLLVVVGAFAFAPLFNSGERA